MSQVIQTNGTGLVTASRLFSSTRIMLSYKVRFVQEEEVEGKKKNNSIRRWREGMWNCGGRQTCPLAVEGVLYLLPSGGDSENKLPYLVGLSYVQINKPVLFSESICIQKRSKLKVAFKWRFDLCILNTFFCLSYVSKKYRTFSGNILSLYIRNKAGFSNNEKYQRN